MNPQAASTGSAGAGSAGPRSDGASSPGPGQAGTGEAATGEAGTGEAGTGEAGTGPAGPGPAGHPAQGPEAAAALLDRVRKLLTKAESDGVTAAEAEALTAKAAELMAKYGIDRALLAARRPETDHPGDRKIDIDNPWARVQAHLLCGLAATLRCQCVLLPRPGPGTRIHIFGFASDIERTDVLYTSLLLQMWQGLVAAQVPDWSRSPRAWRRSWLLGFISAVVSRVRAAEQAATSRATSPAAAEGERMTLVLADRRQVIMRNIEHAYPVTRKTQMTYSGSGYGAGYSEGQRADIGSARLRKNSGRSLTSAG